MALHGDVYVNGDKLLAWEAVWKEVETSTGKDDAASPVYTDRYDVVIAYADGTEIRDTVLQRRGDNAETLSTKVMLKAAWGQRQREKEKEKAKRRGR